MIIYTPHSSYKTKETIELYLDAVEFIPHIVHIKLSVFKVKSSRATTLIYIPLSSYKTEIMSIDPLSYTLFISHLVQIKHGCKPKQTMLFRSDLYPT